MNSKVTKKLVLFVLERIPAFKCKILFHEIPLNILPCTKYF